MFARLIKYAAAAAVAVWLWRRAGRRRARLTSAGATQRMHLLRRRSQGRAAAHAPFAAALAKLDAERKAADQAARDDSAQQMPPPPNPRPRASRAAAAESTEQGLQDEYSDTMDGSHGVEHVLNEFILESGARLHHVCTRLSTFGALDEARSNCVLVVHALTGTHEVHAWWGSLVGPGKPLDTDRFMVVCMNTLGSCFGTCGPASADPSHATGRPYGPRFPETTIRDAAELQARGVVGRQNHRPPHVTTSNTRTSITTHRKAQRTFHHRVTTQARVLHEALGVREVACVIGGSMGGMIALELCAREAEPSMRSAVLLSTNGRHSAWQVCNAAPSPHYLPTISNLSDLPLYLPSISALADCNVRVAAPRHRGRPRLSGRRVPWRCTAEIRDEHL